jgi:hypothetical protein
MKKLFKLGIMAIVVLTLILTVGCPGEDLTNPGNEDGVDFTNYSSNNPAIMVRNNTNQRLVLFKNELRQDMILGGVEPNAGGDGWGIKKDTKFFNTTGEFSMIVLTFDQYKENKNNLAALTTRPYTRVYVFYNETGENVILYEISDRLGGSYILQVENPTNLNVELRSGGVNGPTLGYAPAGMQATRLYVQGGDLDIFPVFKRFNAQRNILETIYPKGIKGPWMDSFVFGEGYPSPQAYDIRDALEGVTARTSGVAYLKIVNSSAGAVRLYKGTEMVYNTLGISYMSNNGIATEFEINMPGTNNVFDEKIRINNYKIGPTGGQEPITVKGTGATEFDLYGDKSYTVTVTGNYNQGTLKVEIDLDAASDVPMDFFTFD